MVKVEPVEAPVKLLTVNLLMEALLAKTGEPPLLMTTKSVVLV